MHKIDGEFQIELLRYENLLLPILHMLEDNVERKEIIDHINKRLEFINNFKSEEFKNK